MNDSIISRNKERLLIFHAQPGGIFLFMGCFMYQYPKQILTIEQQVQSYADAGMEITSREDVEKALKIRRECQK